MTDVDLSKIVPETDTVSSFAMLTTALLMFSSVALIVFKAWRPESFPWWICVVPLLLPFAMLAAYTALLCVAYVCTTLVHSIMKAATSRRKTQ